MAEFGFDQTNGIVEGLHGDDDGGIAPPPPEPTVIGLVQRFMGAGAVPRGASPTDRDESVTPYSEEG